MEKNMIVCSSPLPKGDHFLREFVQEQAAQKFEPISIVWYEVDAESYKATGMPDFLPSVIK